MIEYDLEMDVIRLISNHDLFAILDLKYNHTQFSSSFEYGNAVITYDNQEEASKLRLHLSGKRSMSLDKLKNVLFLFWEMIYFCNGFFPTLQCISFDGIEDKFYPDKIVRLRNTADNLSLIRSNNRLCQISSESLNAVTLKKYQLIRSELKYPTNSIFAVQSYNNIYGEHRLVLASHAAEGIIETKYENKITNRSFFGRIEFLFNPLLKADRKHRTKLFSSIGLTKKKYFELFKETRHFYTHLNRERKRFKKGKEFVADYWILSIAIRMFIMQEIGISYDAQLFKANITSIASWMKEYR